MSDPASILRRLFAIFAGVVLIACATTAAAEASYGEIGHFGEDGTAPGDFKPGESDAIGVDPTNNSVYVVDQPNEAKENEFRIQKFEASGGKYKVVASTTFTPKDDEGEEEPDLVEGIAVDPKLKRIYLLANETRRPEKVKIDAQDIAASELYAFSTEQSGSKLVPASGASTKEGEEGLLAGTKVLAPLSNKQGVSLLEPEGIAVDPQNHDVLIVGHEEKVEGGEELVAVEQVKENGELGARWVDESNVLEEEADSPAVSASGNIYVGGFDEINEIPSSFSDAAKPTTVAATNINEFLEEELIEFPGQPEPESGGALSIGEEGTIYSKAGIARQFNDTKFKFPGVLEFTATGEEEGWTGGQSVAAVGQAGPCKMSLVPAIQIAAGKEHTVFAYDSGVGSGTSKTEFGPKVIEFGPGGSGCASAEATPPAATVNGLPVSESEKIPIEDSVTFASTLTQANALGVQWKFGDGTEQTVPGRQFQHIGVTHKFAEAGPHTVTAVIHTDDLADPQVEVTSDVTILGPEAVTSAPTKIEETAAVLKGSVNPNEISVTECFFEYGTSLSYGQKAPCEPKASELTGEKAIVVSAKVSGLVKGTKYDYRVVAKYAGNESAGTNEPFTTLTDEPPPAVVTGAGSAPEQTTATVHATVNPEGVAVKECKFEYGKTTSYGSSVPCKPAASELGSGKNPVAVSASITGLSAGTSYDFRISASSAGGTSTGSNESFTTAKEPAGPPPEEHTTTTNQTPPGQQGVEPHKETKPPPEPDATLAGNSALVSKTGAFTLKVTCPKEESSCSGTVSLKTLKAVVASAGHLTKSKAAILTLASAPFSVAGGQVKTITLHLSVKARALLARTHSVSAKATIVAHDSAGQTHTTTVVVTLRAAKPAKHH
jgi:hypothetical protein